MDRSSGTGRGAALVVDVMVASCFVIFLVGRFGGENGS